MEDESYLNKRGLTHFWENIDDLKQDKLTAGTNISINNNTISSSQPAATTSSLGVIQVGSGLAISSGGVLSATGGGVADSVAWGHVTGTLADQTDLQDALDAKADSSSLATVATSGSYNDLSNKPTIGNATLTIQKNGTAVDTFTANATTNKSINITVPTTAADVSALPASTKYGASIAVSINTTDYKVTTTLKDQDGNTLGTAQVIDLPLESVVVNGSYDSTNKKIVLTLQNGNTIDIPVADLVAGLQTEITSSNKLASDLVDDTNQTHKFVTAAQITKLNGIATGAEVNQNAFSNVKVGSTTVAADSKTDTLELVAGSNVTLTPDATNDKVTIAATDTTYSDATTSASGLMSASDKTKLNGIASGAEVNVQSDWNQATTTADDYIKNKPTKLSDFTNDSGFITSYTETDPIFSASAAAGITSSDITAWNSKSDFSGSYNDLTNKPTIGNATLTIQKNGTSAGTFTANATSNKSINITVPTATSDLTNDSGFLTTVAWGDVTGKPTFATVATSGSYNDLSNKPTIPAAQVNSDWDAVSGVAQILNKPTLATVATSGSYNDLSNKPTIPTVNNATLTIQKNGTTVQTFTANSSSNKTANITVPTTVAELSDASTYVTQNSLATDLANKQDLLTAGDHIDITNNVIKAEDYVHSESPVPTSAVTPIVTGNMISNGTITADKLATGAAMQLTMSTSDIGEGAALAANTLYGVYQ